MTKGIEIIKLPRIKLIEKMQSLNIVQLNNIPAGFNNNIIWNMGHLIAAQQGICYKRAGLETVVDDDFFNTYKPGSRPEQFLDETELEKICGLLLSTIDKLERDLETTLFDNYSPWITRYGVEITGIADCVRFLPFHEGLHIGAITALSKLVETT